MANHDGLSDVVRRQLHELRIDLDATDKPRQHISGRLWCWCGKQKEAIALIGGAAGVLLFITGLAVLVASSASSAPTSGLGGGPQSASVSLGSVTVQLVSPAYRRVSAIESVLFVHVDVRNAAATRTELAAGDVMLTDPRGALFSPSWYDANGNSVDGFAQPDHTLLALAPGAELQMDLPFLVLSNGPFALHYEPRPDHAAAGEPLAINLVPIPTNLVAAY